MSLDNQQKGVALYITIVIMSVLTTAILALSGIMTTQLKVIFTAGNSVNAFFAADAGIEMALTDRNSPQPTYTGYLDLNGNGSFDPNFDASFVVSAAPKGGSSCVADNFCITSQGSFRNIKRAIRAEY